MRTHEPVFEFRAMALLTPDMLSETRAEWNRTPARGRDPQRIARSRISGDCRVLFWGSVKSSQIAMLSLCRSLIRPQRLTSIVAASYRRNLLFTSEVCACNDIRRWPQPPPQRRDLLLRSILKSQSLPELQNVVSLSLHGLKPGGLLSCLIQFKNIVISDENELPPAELPLFQILSKKIVAKLSSFSLAQVVQLMRIAGLLELECSSPLIQGCCRTLAPRLEEFDVDHLMELFLAFRRLRGTSTLTESLMVSLPTVFESQVEKWDLSDARTSLRALEFAVKVDLKVDKRDLVIDSARKFLPHAPPLHAVMTIYDVAYEGPCHVGPEDHKMHVLLKDCLTIIARNISTIARKQVREIMAAYSNINIFERELHDALWSVAPSWSFDEIMRLVDLSREKDAFSSKDEETLRVLLQTRADKWAHAQDTTNRETRSLGMGMQERSQTFLKRPILQCKSREQLRGLVEQKLHVRRVNVLISCIIHYKNLAMAETGGCAAADDPFFEKLANTVVSKLNSPTYDDCTALLRVARKLELDHSHILVQRVLQELAPRMQDLNLDQIMSLPRYVDYIEGKSPVADNLLLATRLAFESRVKEALDRTDGARCFSALLFTQRHASSHEVQEFVIDSARAFLAQASAETAADVVYAVAFHKSGFVTVGNSEMRNLVKDCLIRIAENLTKFDQKMVRRILSAYGEIDIFSNELNDALWSVAVSLTFDEAMTLFSSIARNKMRLKDLELLKELLVANKEKIGDGTDAGVCSQAMALLALHSPGVHSELGEVGLLLATMLTQPDHPIKKSRYFTRFVRNLAILGIFPEQELDNLFSEEYQRTISQHEPALVQILELEALLRVRFGESCRYVLMPELKERGADLRGSVVIAEDLVDSLRNGLGGDQFFLRNVITPLGIDADLVVATSPDGSPVALSDKQSLLENLPDDTKVVAILQCAEHNVFADLETKRMTFVLREHLLRVQNICPVAINMLEWNSLSSEEKVSLVMRKIEDATRSPHVQTAAK